MFMDCCLKIQGKGALILFEVLETGIITIEISVENYHKAKINLLYGPVI